MNKSLLFLLLAPLATWQCSQRNEISDNQLTDSEKRNGWDLLFDGNSLDNWRTFQQDSAIGWEVQNGEMVALGLGGDHANDLITRDTFSNFELKVDWAISNEGNSGIFYHVVEDTFNAVYQTGPEYQLIDDFGFPSKLEKWQKTGANYAMKPADSTKVHTVPPGEFNSTIIVVHGPFVDHWLNGEKVLQDTLWTPSWLLRKAEGKWKDYPAYGIFKSGHIALQDHGGITRFKNIKIRRLN